MSYKIPKLKKKLEAFILSEDGKISKKNMFKGSILFFATSFLISNSASSLINIGSDLSLPLRDEITTTERCISHSSHGSHSSHASHSSCGPCRPCY
ncbi:MAG: hypothetical protein ACLFPJ_05670 [Candidatus Woesearchaeota archaeon]